MKSDIECHGYVFQVLGYSQTADTEPGHSKHMVENTTRALRLSIATNTSALKEIITKTLTIQP